MLLSITLRALTRARLTPLSNNLLASANASLISLPLALTLLALLLPVAPLPFAPPLLFPIDGLLLSRRRALVSLTTVASLLAAKLEASLSMGGGCGLLGFGGADGGARAPALASYDDTLAAVAVEPACPHAHGFARHTWHTCARSHAPTHFLSW